MRPSCWPMELCVAFPSFAVTLAECRAAIVSKLRVAHLVNICSCWVWGGAFVGNSVSDQTLLGSSDLNILSRYHVCICGVRVFSELLHLCWGIPWPHGICSGFCELLVAHWSLMQLVRTPKQPIGSRRTQRAPESSKRVPRNNDSKIQCDILQSSLLGCAGPQLRNEPGGNFFLTILGLPKRPAACVSDLPHETPVKQDVRLCDRSFSS